MKKIILKINFLVFLFFICSTPKVFSEGTPTLSPNQNTISAVLVAPDLSSGSFLNCLEDNRIYFRIGTNFASEALYFGFDFRTYGVGSPLRANNVFYRIRRPDGSIAVNSTPWNPATASNGSINSYTQAVTGPNIGTTVGGYNPLSFQPTVAGEHWIEFFRSNDGGTTADVSAGTGSRAVAPYFDMTVANNTGAFTKFNGRVHCDKWGLLATNSTFGNRSDFNSKPDLFVYTEDQVILRLSFQDGFQPVAYDLAVNSYGVSNVGSFANTRRSVNAVAAPPLPDGFKIFLNKPDAVYYPIASVPSLPSFLTPAITGCGPFNIRFNISEPGDVQLLLNLNGIAGFQPNTADRILEATDLAAGNNSVTWNGLDGQGNTVTDGGSIQMILSYLKGRFNIPLYDAEINKGGFNVAIIEPVQIANTRMYWDDTLLTNVGTVCVTNAANDQNNITSPGVNNAIIGTNSPAHAWNGDGNPTQTIPAPSIGTSETDGLTCNDFGNVRLINTWGYGIKSDAITTAIFKGCSDLRVVKTFAPNPNYVGGQITFTITASNTSGSNNTNVVVTDVVPNGYSVSTTTPPTTSLGTFSGNTWNIGNLAVGQPPATLTIVATINPSSVGISYINTATIDGDNEEATPADNTSTVTPIPIAPPAITIGNAQILEGNQLSFPITLSNPSGTDITLTFGFTNITTVSGDYSIPIPASITIPAGSTSGTLLVLTSEDFIDELDETFTVFISGSTGVLGNTSDTATGTILDDDLAPSVSIGNQSIIEGNTAGNVGTFTVTLSNPSYLPITVSITTTNGTANGTDFVPVNTTVTIPAGATTGTFTATTVPDFTAETSESFTINGSVTSTNTSNTSTSATGFITDDDANPTFDISDVTVTEGDQAVFTVSLSNASASPITITIISVNGTAGATDFTPINTTVVFPAGSLSVTTLVTTIEDLINEPTENYTLTGSTTPGLTTNTTASGTGIINDDDVLPTVTIGNVTITEGVNPTAVFTVSLDVASSVLTTVVITSSFGSATVTDFNVVNTTVIIPAGQLSVTFPITIIDDTTNEPIETYSINGNVTSGNTTNTNPSATGTILDNDLLPTVTISNQTIIEGNTGTFTVSLSNPSSTDTVVAISTLNGSANGITDYFPVTASVTILAGQLSTTISVVTREDTTYEIEETFNVNGTVTSGNTTNSNPSGIGTITDNDLLPSFTISSANASEGNPINLVITLSNPSYLPTVIALTTVPVTATTGVDYLPITTTITIPAGQTVFTQEITTLEDAVFELDEAFTLNGTTTSGTTNATALGTGIITNDDLLPTISISDETVTEGVTMDFEVILSNPSYLPTVVTISTVNGTADNSDYTPVTTTITIPAGQTIFTVPVATTTDLINEANETFTLNGIVTSGNTSNIDPSGIGTILNDDPTPTVSIDNVTVIEGNIAVFTASLSNPSSLPTTIIINTANGTAIGSDFNPLVNNSITIPAGATSVTFQVITIEDTTSEITENYTVNGNVTSTNTANNNPTGIGTITDDDGSPTISISDSTVSEGDTASFNVTLSNPSSVATIVTIISVNGTAGASDFIPISITLTIPAGQVSATVTIPTLEDVTNEPTENFTINGTVSSGNTQNTNSIGTGTITDDDTAPTFSISSPTEIEGTPLSYVVAISTPSSIDTVITITTSPGTATSPEDFTAVSTTVTIPAGQTSVTVPVATFQDLIDEPAETLTLNGTVTAGTVANTTATGTGTITDNDPTPTITINDVSVVESGIATFTIALSNPSSIATIINLSTSPLTATTNLDYSSVFTSVTIPAGVTSITFPVTTLPDLIFEPSETYNLNGVVTSNNTSNTNPQGLGTITDNDPTPTFTISNESVNEGATATFTVSLSNPSSVDTVITIVTTPVNATSGVDYTPVTTTITIPAGQTSTTVPVVTLNDSTDEPTETFTLNGTVTSGPVTNTSAVGTGTITDNDPTPTVTIDSPSVNEGLPEIFTISLSNPSSVTTTIVVSTSLSVTLNAAAQSDFVPVTSFTVTIPAGQTSATTSVTTTQDTIDEANETFVLIGIITSGNTLNTSAAGVGTILDEDGAPTFTISNTSIDEGGILNFVVSLSNASSTPTVITVTTNPGSALATTDYTPVTTTVTIPAGELSANVNVQTTIDVIDEPTENLTLNGTLISGPFGINTTAFGTGLILDNDPTPTISINNPSTPEESNEIFTVSLSNPSSFDTVIILSTTPNTASVLDYSTVTSTTVTIPTGATSIVFNVSTSLDLLDENDETFILNGVVTSGNTSNTTPSGTGTITDNDATPTFIISDETVTEGATATFTVTLSSASSFPTVINVITQNVTAIAGSDYVAITTTVTIPAGQTTANFTVVTSGDSTNEPTENFTVLGTVTSGTIGNPTATGIGTINDDDLAPSFTISSINIPEGSNGTFTVTLSNPTSIPTVISLTSADGTAGGADYNPLSNVSITIPAGETTFTFPVVTVTDLISEGSETFFVNGTSTTTSNPTAQGIGTIIDGSGKPIVTINSPSITEGGILVFTASLNIVSTTDVVLTVVTTPASATNEDFTPIIVPVTITILAGQLTSTPTNIQTTQDEIDEPTETFTLNGTVTSGNTSNTDSSGIGTILDNDPLPTIFINSPSTAEGGSLVFTATLSNPSSTNVVLTILTTPGSASNSDFGPITNPVTITILAGQLSGSTPVTINTVTDPIDELTESFTLNGTVTSANTSNTDPFGTGTITDDTIAPTISINSPTVTEGGILVFTATLSNPSSTNVVLTVLTATGSASGSDFDEIINPVTITILASQLTGSTPINIQSTQDLIDELDETFTLNGTVISGTTANTSPSGVGTILDNDPLPTVSITGTTVVESTETLATSVTFTATLSNPSYLDTVITVITNPGTASNLDFTPITLPVTITIPAGQTAGSTTVLVPTTDDAIDEQEEQFTLVGTITSGNTVNTLATGTGTITDADGVPEVIITGTSVLEGQNVVFTATLSNPSTIATIITVLTAPGTASNSDFIPVTNPVTITIPAGALTGSTTVPVATEVDTIDEPIETFTLNGTVTSGNTSNTNPVGIGTILDNTFAPTITLSNPSVIEGGILVFTATLSNPSATPITISVVTNENTADNTDFIPITTPVTITIPAGSLTGSTTVTVNSIVDAISEPSENFYLDGTVISGTTLNPTAQGIGTIGDPAGSLPIVSIIGTTVTEGGIVVFTASINVPSSTPIVLTVVTAPNTAIQPADYNPITAPITITIPAGSLTGNVTVPVTTIVDTISEPTETFALNSTITSGNTANVSAVGIGSILESLPLPTITLSNPTVTEGGTLVFTATLSNASSTNVVLTVITTPSSASNEDFNPILNPVTITIPAGSLTGSTSVSVISLVDAITEGTENFTLNGTVTSVNTLNLTPVGLGTIGESLPLPTVIINNPTVVEGNTLLFTATLSNASATPVIITFVTTPGSASNTDFTPTTGTITIPAGALTGITTISVPSIEDVIDENSEDFTLNGTVTSGNTDNTTPFGTGTITDNDATLIANPDPLTITCTTSGIIGNILSNDTINGNPVTTSNVVLTITSSPIANLQVDSQGNVTVFSGITFGTYTINYRICESANINNCKTGVATIIVSDTTPPTWVTSTLPSSTLSVSCDDSLVAPTLLATDSCSSANVVLNPDVIIAGSCAGNYTITRSWTATDLAGNTITYTQTITVTDTTAPVFTASSLPSFSLPLNCSDTIPAPATVTATDNCNATTPITVFFTENIIPALATECPIKSRIIRTWKASDACGNVAIPFIQTIIISDQNAPTIDPAYPLTIPATCDAIPDIIQPDIRDNCATIANGLVITQLADVTSVVTATGTFTITRAWEATDGCNAVIFTQIVNVTVPNYIQQAPQINADCNIDNRIEINLLEQIQKTYPAVAKNGTWIDINSVLGSSFDAANGTFKPYNVPVGVYYLEYRNPDPDCPSVIKFTIRVDDDCLVLCETPLTVKNAITPNGDNVNETLEIDGINNDCIVSNSLEIYNRWGIKVYEKENYDNIIDPFVGQSDGRSTYKKGDLLPTGTYFYILNFKSKDGVSKSDSGFIYLTRE